MALGFQEGPDKPAYGNHAESGDDPLQHVSWISRQQVDRYVTSDHRQPLRVVDLFHWLHLPVFVQHGYRESLRDLPCPYRLEAASLGMVFVLVSRQ